MSNNDNSNTLGSYVDSATGMAQRAMGSVTGGNSQTQNTNRNNGTWDQTLGSAKESLGNVMGNESLRETGIDQNNAGKETEARGQLQDLGSGLGDRAAGRLGEVGAAVKGDREEEEKWRAVHDEGKGRQRGVEGDIDRRDS